MMEEELKPKGPENDRQIAYSSSDYRSFQAIMAMRIACFASFIMLIGNVLFSITLMQISDEVRIDSALITVQNKTEQMIDIEPVARDMSGFDILNDTMLRYYIKARHSVVPDSDVLKYMWERGGVIHRMSSPAIYRDFTRNAYGAKDPLASRLGKIRQNIIPPSDVEILSVRKVANNLWNVDFDLIEYDEFSSREQRSRWNVSVKATNLPSRVLFSKDFSNPLGFVVTEYNIAPKIVK